MDKVLFIQKHQVYNQTREADNDNKSHKSSKNYQRSSEKVPKYHLILQSHQLKDKALSKNYYLGYYLPGVSSEELAKSKVRTYVFD